MKVSEKYIYLCINVQAISELPFTLASSFSIFAFSVIFSIFSLVSTRSRIRDLVLVKSAWFVLASSISISLSSAWFKFDLSSSISISLSSAWFVLSSSISIWTSLSLLSKISSILLLYSILCLTGVLYLLWLECGSGISVEGNLKYSWVFLHWPTCT